MVAGAGGGKSGLYYPNKMGRIYLMAMEEVMGKNGVNAVLNMAKLSHLIDNYPPGNLDKLFSFDDFGSLSQAVDDMYGPRGGRGLSLRAGRATFAQGLTEFGAIIGMADLAFKLVPLTTKLKVGLRAMAETFSKFTDQETYVEELPDRFNYVIVKCPNCWGRKSDKPVCYVAVGLLQEGLRWVSGGREFYVEQVTGKSSGDPNCQFHILKEPTG